MSAALRFRLVHGPVRSTTQAGVLTNHIVTKINPGTISNINPSMNSRPIRSASRITGKTRQANLQRLAKADRTHAHGLKCRVHHDGLAEHAEDERQHATDDQKNGTLAGRIGDVPFTALSIKTDGTLAITPIPKKIRKCCDRTVAVRVRTGPMRKSLSAKRADIVVLVMKASLGSSLKYLLT